MKKFLTLFGFYFFGFLIAKAFNSELLVTYAIAFITGVLYVNISEALTPPSPEIKDVKEQLDELRKEWHDAYVNNGKLHRINIILKQGINKYVATGDRKDLMDAVLKASEVQE